MLNLTNDNQPKEVLLADYVLYPFSFDHVSLDFQLHADQTQVKASYKIRKRSHVAGLSSADLRLDGGPYMTLLAVILDGKILSDTAYQLTDDALIIHNVPDAFTLELHTEVNPKENTRLEGLYISNGVFCTQCEAEGFRHITYYPDRPDVLSIFDVKITAPKKDFPVLLSNGNPAGYGDLDGGLHYATWHDPHPKPSYLFALVAGPLAALTDHYQTSEGRDVTLNIYVRPEDTDKCDYAMGALKRSMKWDEDRFGLAYDLDIYNIVAISDFNMGAMENKGLNIFNTKYVLASTDTATDTDFAHVEGVIGHEYFHNWTGNRVTCRDWFQLSLKEGLTVYRDQEFSSDMGARIIKRLDDVKVLRAFQFPEDAGPFAHSIRPESYIEINNFYTATVYNKGAEVIRMMATLIGHTAFRKGMDLYFERHDGAAVTCEDFVQVMEDASGFDLGQFRLWYGQAGTPEVTVDYQMDHQVGQCQISIRQRTPATPGQPNKKPMLIPIRLGFVTPNGDCQFAAVQEKMSGSLAPSTNIRSLGNGEFLLLLKEDKQTFVFDRVTKGAVPSILREFSAPVILKSDLSRADQLTIFKHDTDAFNRVEQSDLLIAEEVEKFVANQETGAVGKLSSDIVQAFKHCLKHYEEDPALLSALLSMPSEGDILSQVRFSDLDRLFAARRLVQKRLAKQLRAQIVDIYTACQEKINGMAKPQSAEVVHFRRLKNVCLGYMALINGRAENMMIIDQYFQAENMTDRLAAMQAIAHSKMGQRHKILRDFYRQWRDNDLVIDKWFSVQAMSSREDVIETVEALLTHKAFHWQNPNRVRSLIAVFISSNLSAFHHASGRGYNLLKQVIVKLDRINPQTAARLLTPMGRYQKLDMARKRHIKAALKEILSQEDLSRPVFEVTSKAIKGLDGV